MRDYIPIYPLAWILRIWIWGLADSQMCRGSRNRFMHQTHLDKLVTVDQARGAPLGPPPWLRCKVKAHSAP